MNAGYTFTILLDVNTATGLSWPGKDPDRDVYFEVFGVSKNFIETMDMNLKTGRSFSKDFGMDSLNIIVNESCRKNDESERPYWRHCSLP